MTLEQAEALAKPYVYRGRRHSVRTLHTALQNAGKTRGAFSADRDVIWIRPYDGSASLAWPRTFDAAGLSIVGERDT